MDDSRNPCISKHFWSLPRIKIIISHLYQLTGNVHLQFTPEKLVKNINLYWIVNWFMWLHDVLFIDFTMFSVVQFQSLLDSLIFLTECSLLYLHSHHVDNSCHWHVWLEHAAQGLPHHSHVLYHIMLALRQSSRQEQRADAHFNTKQQHTSVASPHTMQQMISTTHCHLCDVAGHLSIIAAIHNMTL